MCVCSYIHMCLHTHRCHRLDARCVHNLHIARRCRCHEQRRARPRGPRRVMATFSRGTSVLGMRVLLRDTRDPRVPPPRRQKTKSQTRAYRTRPFYGFGIGRASHSAAIETCASTGGSIRSTFAEVATARKCNNMNAGGRRATLQEVPALARTTHAYRTYCTCERG